MSALSIVYSLNTEDHPRGRCRYCGCTDHEACVHSRGGLQFSCWWVDKDHTVCSSPECMEKLKQELRRKAGRA